MFSHGEPNTVQLVVSFLVSTIFAFICAYYAEKKGRYPLGWFILGFFFALISLIVLFFLPPLKKEDAGQPAETQPLGSSQAKEELKESLPPPFDRSKEENRLWYYLDQNHEQIGPVSLIALRELWDRGLLELNSYVWSEGMEKWERVDQLPDLKAAFKKPEF